MKTTDIRAFLGGVVALGVLTVGIQTGAAQTVFHYNYSATVPPDLFDIGGAGNDATVGPLAVLSDDVPTLGVFETAGVHSLDSSDPTAVRANQAGAVTKANSLLTNSAIEAAGGFTFETWFKWHGGGAVNSIIDYAGTDKLVIDVRGGAPPTLAMRMDPADYAIGTAVADTWHYVAFVFDSTGNTQVGGTITGQATAYFDSLEPIDLGTITKSTFGDGLVRPIGIGQHPIGFDLDFFNGRVFESRVSLGALAPEQLLFVPEPGTSVLVGLGLMVCWAGVGRRLRDAS